MFKKPCKDTQGNSFESIKTMCEYYGISRAAYDGRKKRGWSLERNLTTPTKEAPAIQDPFGHTFASISEMCRQYNVNRSTYWDRIQSNYTQIEALGIIPFINKYAKNVKITDAITVIKHADIDDKRKFFLCSVNGVAKAILSRNTILRYAIEYHTANPPKQKTAAHLCDKPPLEGRLL